mmetsp:Transcript_17970/g.62155  ORF Transcript_17970/g.62155 Transcript_17970/m.62155 type:complete len:732 (-) Transcript_17970:23-2218(-)
MAGVEIVSATFAKSQWRHWSDVLNACKFMARSAWSRTHSNSLPPSPLVRKATRSATKSACLMVPPSTGSASTRERKASSRSIADTSSFTAARHWIRSWWTFLRTFCPASADDVVTPVRPRARATARPRCSKPCFSVRCVRWNTACKRSCSTTLHVRNRLSCFRTMFASSLEPAPSMTASRSLANALSYRDTVSPSEHVITRPFDVAGLIRAQSLRPSSRSSLRNTASSAGPSGVELEGVAAVAAVAAAAAQAPRRFRLRRQAGGRASQEARRGRGGARGAPRLLPDGPQEADMVRSAAAEAHQKARRFEPRAHGRRHGRRRAARHPRQGLQRLEREKGHRHLADGHAAVARGLPRERGVRRAQMPLEDMGHRARDGAQALRRDGRAQRRGAPERGATESEARPTQRAHDALVPRGPAGAHATVRGRRDRGSRQGVRGEALRGTGQRRGALGHGGGLLSPRQGDVRRPRRLDHGGGLARRRRRPRRRVVHRVVVAAVRRRRGARPPGPRGAPHEARARRLPPAFGRRALGRGAHEAHARGQHALRQEGQRLRRGRGLRRGELHGHLPPRLPAPPPHRRQGLRAAALRVRAALLHGLRSLQPLHALFCQGEGLHALRPRLAPDGPQGQGDGQPREIRRQQGRGRPARRVRARRGRLRLSRAPVQDAAGARPRRQRRGDRGRGRSGPRREQRRRRRRRRRRRGGLRRAAAAAFAVVRRQVRPARRRRQGRPRAV